MIVYVLIYCSIMQMKQTVLLLLDTWPYIGLTVVELINVYPQSFYTNGDTAHKSSVLKEASQTVCHFIF